MVVVLCPFMRGVRVSMLPIFAFSTFHIFLHGVMVRAPNHDLVLLPLSICIIRRASYHCLAGLVSMPYACSVLRPPSVISNSFPASIVVYGHTVSLKCYHDFRTFSERTLTCACIEEVHVPSHILPLHSISCLHS